jgi:hypothetical protein
MAGEGIGLMTEQAFQSFLARVQNQEALIDFLDEIDLQIEAQEKGHMLGFVEGMSNKYKFDHANNPGTQRIYMETLLDPQSSIPDACRALVSPQIMQEADLEDIFKDAYAVGYGKGFETETKEETKNFQYASLSKAGFDKLFRKKQASDSEIVYEMTAERKKTLEPGLLDPSQIQVSLEEGTELKILSEDLGDLSQAASSFFALYATSDEEKRARLRESIVKPILENEEEAQDPDFAFSTEAAIREAMSKASTVETIAGIDFTKNDLEKHAVAIEQLREYIVQPEDKPLTDFPRENETTRPTTAEQTPSKPSASQPSSPLPSAPQTKPFVTEASKNPPSLPNRASLVPSLSTTMPFSAVNPIFSKSILEDYNTQKTIKSNFAQKFFSYEKKRTQQITLVDDIRAHLDNLPTNDGNSIQPKQKAIILHAVMNNMLQDLKKERRWKKVFGTKSRLEVVLESDMKKIEEGFKTDTSAFTDAEAKTLIQEHIKDPKILRECNIVLDHQKMPSLKR